MEIATLLFLAAFFAPPAAVVAGIVVALLPTARHGKERARLGQPVTQH